MPTTTQHLDACIAQLKEAAAGFEELCQSLTNEQRNYKPTQKAWSVNQIMRHLVLGNGMHIPLLQKGISGRQLAKPYSGPYKAGLLGGKFIKMMQPGGKPVGALKPTHPEKDSYPEGILDEYKRTVGALLQLAEDAKRINANKRKIRLSFNPLPFPGLRVADAVKLLAVHNLRHLQQAQITAKATS